MVDDSRSDSQKTFVSFPLLDLSSDAEFPGTVYLCIQHKMVRYKNKGDALDAAAFNKLVYSRVRYVFIDESERTAFQTWITTRNKQETAARAALNENPETAPIAIAADDQRRAMMDIFASPKDDRQVKAAVETSKRLVTEFLKRPFAISNIQSMQRYSKGCVDHSVNVSVLAVFLGLRLGYTHQVILENLAMGGLFHDIGKTLVENPEEKMMSEDDPAMQLHPKLGAEHLEKNREISNEIRMIVAQHHEYLDGSGYPARLRGLAVYDLARVVAIANLYDNLVSQSTLETMKERCEEACGQLESGYEGKLDAKKLEKCIKILRYSFL